MENQKVSTNSRDKRASRRKLLIKTAKTAPVITAVAAAPVWATSQALSGFQSGGMSSRTRIVQFNGYSPGYFHEHTNNGNGNGNNSNQTSTSSNTVVQSPLYNGQTPTANDCEAIQGSSKLPAYFYDIFYGGLGGIFPSSSLNAKVRDVLDPSHWNGFNGEAQVINGNTITQVDRYMLTAFFNAHPLYGASGYPYTQQEVLQFCEDYELGNISYDDAKMILSNLIHEGLEDINWEAGTLC